MGAATLVASQAEAMRAAAKNENGAMMGFMGMGMATQAGGMNAQNLYAMGQSQDLNSWKCTCGTVNKGNFCSNCGQKKAGNGNFRCSKCGWTPENPENPPRFCPNCGDPFGQEDKQ